MKLNLLKYPVRNLLADEAERIYKVLPPEYRDAFFCGSGKNGLPIILTSGYQNMKYIIREIIH